MQKWLALGVSGEDAKEVKARSPEANKQDENAIREASRPGFVRLKEGLEYKEDLDEARPVYKADNVQTDHMYKADYITEGCTDCDDNFDLDSLLEEINKVDLKETKTKPKASSTRRTFYNKQISKIQKELKATQIELKESKKAFKSVKDELNEVNLLNSKLLYVNRIFKANTLTDGQKLRVVESLDKEHSVKEA